MSAALLRADSVTKNFGGFTAVSDVSMRVAAGEVVGLLGANGAGKTTLIRMLLGLLAPTAGAVELLGGPPDRDARSRLGYVPQGLGLYRDLTIEENVAFVTRTYGASPPDLPDTIAAQANRLIGDVSLGVQRQVAFLAALAHRPAVLVLDEPTSGVDALARASLWDTIRAQVETGVGVLVTTHYMQEAAQCDRLLLMSDGVLVAQGSESDVVGGTTAIEVRTEEWATAFAALKEAGQAVTLAGRDVRVADADAERLRSILRGAGVEAELVSVPATIEERMTVLARASADR